MNWHKLLHNAWNSFLKKKKNNGEVIMPYLNSFAENYKTRLAVIERHLQRKDYNFGKWKAILIPKKDGGNPRSIYYRPSRFGNTTLSPHTNSETDKIIFNNLIK